MTFLAIHVGAHVFNVERYAEAYNSPTDRDLLRALSGLGSGNSSTYLNPIRSQSTVCIHLSDYSHIASCVNTNTKLQNKKALFRKNFWGLFFFFVL